MDVQDNNPKINPYLIGQVEAENYFYNAFSSGNLHNSWLITGPKGIGKATFAYRIARYIFSRKKENTNVDLKFNLESNKYFDDPSDYLEQDTDFFDSFDTNEMSKQSESNIDNQVDLLDTSPLKISCKDKVFEKMNQGGIADLMIIEKEWADSSKTKLKTEIIVEQIRKLKEFFSKTSYEYGFQIAIIDSVDDMNINAANALLKILEEPPKNSLILLISHKYENVLDTIKSRCQILKLKALSNENLNLLITKYLPKVTDVEKQKLLKLGCGSIGNVINIYNNDGLDIFELFYDSVKDNFNNKNTKIFELLNLIENNQQKLEIFINVYIQFLDLIIKFTSGLKLDFIDNKQQEVISLFKNVNPDNLFKIREQSLDEFYLVDKLNLDYFSVMIACFERLKNAYR